ncbi:MAG: hypothetical protein HYU37_16745 [Acidobacteria bacterium]|nr:hypothetical protein [Acidobacteriota bacterium]
MATSTLRSAGLVAVGVVIGLVVFAMLIDPPSADPVPAPSTDTDIRGDEPSPAAEVETDPDVLTAPPPLDASAPAGTPRYSLEDAAARGLIEYEIEGTGASSGESLTFAVRRLSDSDIDVYIVPGTVLMPSSSGAQRMVAWNVVRGIVVNENETTRDLGTVTSIYLPDTSLRLYTVEAYCLDFDLENPADTDRFEPVLANVVPAQPIAAAVEPDVRAAQLMRRGKDAGLSFRGIQVAIWADRNHKTKEEIAAKFSVEDQEMNDAFQMLLNTPPPKQKQRR